MRIEFNYDNVKYRIRRTGEVKEFLGKVIRDENKIPGDLFFIFTTEENLKDINLKFLNHDYYTDVISFDYSAGDMISGEIYISVETVRNNADIYKTSMPDELLRVMIHGVLHLCGYKDGNEEERDLMFARQESKVKEFAKGR